MSKFSLYSSQSFPARLAAVMSEKSLTTGQLATESGLPYSIIQKYLDDEAAPNLGMVEDLAVALDVHPGWLAFGIGSKVAPSVAELASAFEEDLGLTASQLDDRYNQDGDGEHPLFNRASWIRAVSEHDSLLGYWEWVCYRLKALTAEIPKVD